MRTVCFQPGPLVMPDLSEFKVDTAPAAIKA